MKASSVNTPVNLYFIYILLAISGWIASCQLNSVPQNQERRLASTDTEAFERVMQEAPVCPQGTQLEFNEIQIDVERCLSQYIHDRMNQGLHQQYECSIMPPQQISLLRNLWPNKSHSGVPVIVRAPMSDPRFDLRIGTNAQGYFLEVLPNDSTLKPTPEFVKAEIRNMTARYGVNGARVRLNRCECDLTIHSVDECTSFFQNNPADPEVTQPEVEGTPASS